MHYILLLTSTLTVASFELESDRLPLLVDVVLCLDARVVPKVRLCRALLERRRRRRRRRGRRVRHRRRAGLVASGCFWMLLDASRRLWTRTALKVRTHRDYLLAPGRRLLREEKYEN